MVFREAARKTGALMVLSAALGIGILTFLTEDVRTPAGMVVSPGQHAMGDWLVFALGLFIGGLMIGTYAYIVHVEGKRLS